MYRVVSLFSGCGGSDLGVLGGFNFLKNYYDKLPVEIVFANDNDSFAVETYNSNFKHKANCFDIRKIHVNDIPNCDVIIGGFPCQSFSTVNPKKNTKDERANLYLEMHRIINKKKPLSFIAENVKGLVTLERGGIINKIVKDFEKIGYNVYYKVLNAADFGVPQKRERVFIIGIRTDIQINYKFPNPICDQFNTNKKWVPLKKVINKIDIKDLKYYFSEKAVIGMKNAKPNMKRGLFQDLNQPCLTITSHLAKVSLNSRDPVLLVDPKKEIYRRFTVREAASIQSFPKNFKFPVSDFQSYKQIGNAIPPVLIWYVMKSLLEQLNEV